MGILLFVLVLVGLAAFEIGWRDQPDPVIDTLITPPIVKYAGTDEARRTVTEQRRKVAATMKVRAHRVESGDTVRELLRRVN